MRRTFSTLTHAHVSGVHGPTGTSALKHAVVAPNLDPEWLTKRPSMVGNSVKGLIQKQHLATPAHVVSYKQCTVCNSKNLSKIVWSGTFIGAARFLWVGTAL